MQRFRAILRIEYEAEGEVDAELIAVAAQSAVEETCIELDRGDTVIVSQVAPETSGVTPEELITSLTASRNALILTKTKACWDAAKELDKVIYSLERHDHSFVGAYDYGHFFDVAKEVLNEAEGEDDT